MLYLKMLTKKQKKEKDVVSKKSSKLIMMHSSKKRVFNDNLEDCGESSILLFKECVTWQNILHSHIRSLILYNNNNNNNNDNIDIDWTKHVTSQQINIKCLLECEYNQPS